MASYVDYSSPGAQFAYDLNDSPLFRKDSNNYVNVLSSKQLNTLAGTSLLDIFLSKGNVVEPHYHPNADELVYCISGIADIALLNLNTNRYQYYRIQPGQVVNLPQGWWHYEIAVTDQTHLLAIFNAPIPEVVFGSDLLRLTPPGVFAYTYCLDETTLQAALSPIRDTVFLGPPAGCSYNPMKGQTAGAQQPAQPSAAGYEPRTNRIRSKGDTGSGQKL
ncbi:cupin domain-containing protein [Paenibacillus sp. N4]|nr:cupin domain-containing protein [Paenibacillus vietnamensis]MCA0754758.1 cupin domain-containing protein [Paenibacillus vietnamensis]